MGTPRFVHLHLHTDYSLLDGACDIKELVSEAARRGMPAVAVTDHGNLFAAEQFYHQAATRGVKPIIGCEVYVARGSRHDRGNEAGASSGRGASGRTRPAQHQPPGAALRECRRLSQSGSPGFRRLSRRFLLQAADRLRPAGQTQQRLDRALRVPERHGGGSAGRRALRSGSRQRASAPGYFRQGQFLPGGAGPGPGCRSAGQSRPGAPLA